MEEPLGCLGPYPRACLQTHIHTLGLSAALLPVTLLPCPALPCLHFNRELACAKNFDGAQAKLAELRQRMQEEAWQALITLI